MSLLADYRFTVHDRAGRTDELTDAELEKVTDVIDDVVAKVAGALRNGIEEHLAALGLEVELDGEAV